MRATHSCINESVAATKERLLINDYYTTIFLRKKMYKYKHSVNSSNSIITLYPMSGIQRPGAWLRRLRFFYLFSLAPLRRKTLLVPTLQILLLRLRLEIIIFRTVVTRL